MTDSDIRSRYGLSPDAAVVRKRAGAGGTVRVRPDSFAVVEVASGLDDAVWDRPVAVAGTTVTLSVQGAFVGEGSPVAVTLRDARNRSIGKATGAMHRDRATVELHIDRSAADREPDGVLAAADVRLPELGLDVVSAPLLVLPSAELVDARWSVGRAAEGDVVGLSARLDGSAGGVERVARETAEVAVLVRTDDGAAFDEPVAVMRVRADGGRIALDWTATLALDRWTPATQAQLDGQAAKVGAGPGQPPYFYGRPHLVFRVRLAGLEAESAPLAVDDWLELRHRVNDEPAAERGYALTLADGSQRQGTLDADGRAREDGLPPGPVEVRYEPAPPPGASDGATEEVLDFDAPEPAP